MMIYSWNCIFYLPDCITCCLHWRMSVLADKCFVIAHDGKCELERAKYSDIFNTLW